MRRLLKKFRDIFLVQIKYRKYKINKGFHAGKRTNIWAKATMVIGKNFYLGRDSFIETDCIIGDNVIFGNETPTATVVDIAEPMAVALTSGVELAFTDMSPVRVIATLLPTVAFTTGVTLVVASCPTAA
jgi:hypothetical protein